MKGTEAYEVCCRSKSKAAEEPKQSAEEREGHTDEHRKRCTWREELNELFLDVKSLSRHWLCRRKMEITNVSTASNQANG